MTTSKTEELAEKLYRSIRYTPYTMTKEQLDAIEEYESFQGRGGKMSDSKVEELLQVLKKLRKQHDNYQQLDTTMVEVDALLERYEDSAKDAAMVDLEDFVSKKVVVTYLGGKKVVGNISQNKQEGSYLFLFDRKDFKSDDSYGGYQDENLTVFTRYSRNGVRLQAETEHQPAFGQVELRIFHEGEQKRYTGYSNHPENIVDIQLFGEPKTVGGGGIVELAIEETSQDWAEALTSLIDFLGGDGPSLWNWSGETPTPDKVVNYLKEHVKYLEELAANSELDACCNYLEINGEYVYRDGLRRFRRPQPTLKSQALKDLETVRRNSDNP